MQKVFNIPPPIFLSHINRSSLAILINIPQSEYNIVLSKDVTSLNAFKYYKPTSTQFLFNSYRPQNSNYVTCTALLYSNANFIAR